MYETYRIMSAKLPKELQNLELEDLCEMYAKEDSVIKPWLERKQAFDEKQKKILAGELEQIKKSEDPKKTPTDRWINFETLEPKSIEIKKAWKKRDEIYRTMYCKLYPMMLSVQKNYPMLTPVQRVEVTEMILISTLRCYSQQKKKNTKFSTYYMTNLKNGMMTQINSMKCNKRSVWMNMIEDEEQSDYALATQSSNIDGDLSGLLKDIDGATSLSTLEKQYIKKVMEGYTKPEELASQMEIQKYVEAPKPKIKKKGLITIPMEQKPFNKTKAGLNIIKKLKKSIKAKFEIEDRALFSV